MEIQDVRRFLVETPKELIWDRLETFLELDEDPIVLDYLSSHLEIMGIGGNCRIHYPTGYKKRTHPLILQFATGLSVSSIDPLYVWKIWRSAPKARKLEILEYCDLSDLSYFNKEDLLRIESLKIKYYQPEELHVLRDWKNLKELEIAYPSIETLVDGENLPQIEKLTIKGSKISNPKALQNLKEITIRDYLGPNLDWLLCLPKLERVNLSLTEYRRLYSSTRGELESKGVKIQRG